MRGGREGGKGGLGGSTARGQNRTCGLEVADRRARAPLGPRGGRDGYWWPIGPGWGGQTWGGAGLSKTQKKSRLP